ncbi:DUF427 domain-containing protein [Alterisphingorhabdus coralli]|uniref:DUF427 domain-containing protein n=1 Tax=Alterisphingorhabdus coralli TaxID=3071408 RepID=A0AA97FA80_9SPHN|nr:DUF427 domain-containing protein [Parasphingorhabdus sp. SCSIO 66989]WOE75355.1 DUF427 domain-containing protein [Parasphingorhabdus sp. SCSIO 66989]
MSGSDLKTETVGTPLPSEHFMHAKPVTRKIRVHRRGKLIAKSNNALRITEVAKGPIDPVLYLPKEDVIAPLRLIEGKTTHCPLKGDANYYSVDATGEPIVWTYTKAFDFAAAIKRACRFLSRRSDR